MCENNISITCHLTKRALHLIKKATYIKFELYLHICLQNLKK